MELEVAEIAKSLKVEKKEVLIALSELNYIVNNNQKWELTEQGTELFTFGKLPVLVFEIEHELERVEDENIISKKIKNAQESKVIKCTNCKKEKHPGFYGANGSVCNPCLRRYWSRKNR